MVSSGVEEKGGCIRVREVNIGVYQEVTIRLFKKKRKKGCT